MGIYIHTFLKKRKITGIKTTVERLVTKMGQMLTSELLKTIMTASKISNNFLNSFSLELYIFFKPSGENKKLKNIR